MTRISGLLVLVLLILSGAYTQDKPFGATPSDRQLAWQEMDMYVIIHFTPTTFENKEWGYGDADPAIFNPKQFDANQIIGAVKNGGFKGVIFVAKHHDGFCLWPTATTSYNISKSPWRNGKGDMVKEMETACRKAGLRFGVYCSPWDRNSALYGTHDYVKLYRAQLKELYSRYGSLFMSWHDGANGGDGYYGGRKDKVNVDRSTYYGWDTTWAMTRKMQPGATIFSDIGPDVRWVGNERGEAGDPGWATITPIPLPGKAKAGPGDLDDRNLTSGDRFGKYWIPAECDVPLRPGWFFHPEQNDKVKSPEQLFQLYLKSVGRGGSLDLGLSPDTRGLLHENDVKALEDFGRLVKESFAKNLAAQGNGLSSALTDSDRYSYTKGDVFTVTWAHPQAFNLVRLRENIKFGQRIGRCVVEAMVNGQWETLGEGTSIGACRIFSFPTVSATQLRVRITDSAAPAMLSELGVFIKSAL